MPKRRRDKRFGVNRNPFGHFARQCADNVIVVIVKIQRAVLPTSFIGKRQRTAGNNKTLKRKVNVSLRFVLS
jgi:hypothetical protein